MRKIFIRVFYDSNDIKLASIWKIALVDENSHMLYIETLHEKVSELIPEEKYIELSKDSYFKGLTSVDSNIATLKLSDAITNKEISNDINIFVDTDDKIREKIKNYFNTYYDNESEIMFVFKDSLEELLFLSYIKDTLSSINKVIFVMGHYVLDYNNENYNKICEFSMNHMLEEVKEEEESVKALCVYMRIIIETLILKDFHIYIEEEK